MTEAIKVNGEEALVETPDEFQRRRYLDLVWNMDKKQMFAELMRVHATSTQMLNAAQLEIQNLKAVIAEYDERKRLH